MSYTIRQGLGMTLLAAAAACSRVAPENRGQSAHDRPGIETTPKVIDQQGATLEGEAAAAEQRAGQRAEGDGHDATAKAKLVPLAGSDVEGTAALREAVNDVQIELALRGAEPGASRVAVRDSGQCEPGDAREKVSASATVPSETGLGTLLVDERGEGKLDLTLKDANLKTEGRGSLLGKALVVYRMVPPEKPGERAERVVACGRIVPG